MNQRIIAIEIPGKRTESLISGNRRTMQGTVLSVAKKDRRLNGQKIEAGTPIACTICHDGD